MSISSLAVVNSGPLIALARVGLLDLLPKVFDRVVVPAAVERLSRPRA